MGQSQSAEIPSCLMIYVHTFSETIKNETKIKGTKKNLPKIYRIEKRRSECIILRKILALNRNYSLQKLFGFHTKYCLTKDT